MSIQALREQKNALAKEAKNLLANKGDQVWTKEDQAKFDTISDKIELISTQIEAHQRLIDDEADRNFNDAERYSGLAPKKKTEAEKAIDIFLRKQSSQMTAEEMQLIHNTMSTTTGSQGGFTVQPEVAATIIEALRDFGAMRKLASQISTQNGVDLSYPTTDGTSEEGEIIAQNAPASDSNPSFGTVPLNVFKFGSRVITVPIELLQDSSIDVQAMVYKRLRDRIGRIQNRMFTTGTGTGQPFGLTVAAASGRVGATGSTLTVTYDDLVDLVDSLDVAYTDGKMPNFMFGQTMRRTVRKIKDSAGRPIWTPSYDAGITAATPDLLMGYEVAINNNMPVPGANNKSIAFGDIASYMIRDAMEITLFKFEDSAYLKNGQIGFLGWARAGGNLLDANGVRCYQHSAT